jgi:hypothetical protein
VVLEHIVFPPIGVERFCKAALETYQVRAAFVRGDAVDEAEYVLGVPVIVLKRDFDLEVITLAFETDRLPVQCILVLVQELNE